MFIPDVYSISIIIQKNTLCAGKVRVIYFCPKTFLFLFLRGRLPSYPSTPPAPRSCASGKQFRWNACDDPKKNLKHLQSCFSNQLQLYLCKFLWFSESVLKMKLGVNIAISEVILRKYVLELAIIQFHEQVNLIIFSLVSATLTTTHIIF